ncbi:aspartyl protease family protein [Sphingomonas bacterium]|uniref:aspartyl protease family protein n=1 Tax=Sphingomonas bacterium TaxID=1895847 RepID=UPI001575F85A|nr:aspartyl protease family protein [Sphingomonas bacterium]
MASDPAGDTVTETALLLGTSQDRMTVPVSIGSHGPWPFIIDTGAERTVVSRQLAAQLGLDPGPELRVVAMTGPSAVGSVLIPQLSVSTLVQPTITAPLLEARNIGAAGMLGIDTLQGHSIDIDFDRSAMTVRPSRKRRVVAGSHGGEIVVVARPLFGQLIVTDARWRGKRIAVVIDTGAAMTVGNPALLAMMAGRARPLGPTSSISVTGLTLEAQAYLVSDLTIGGIGLANVPVAIADATPFHRFGLTSRPALMLGMDALRLFRRVKIDFANRDVEFTLPRSAGERLGLVVPVG